MSHRYLIFLVHVLKDKKRLSDTLTFAMGLLLRITLWAYMAWFSTCNLTDLEWETILPDITSLCPSIDVCGRTDVDVNNSTVEKNPCCLGCSCDRDCDGEDCCFDDTNLERNESNAACLNPSLSQSIGEITYKFLIGPPTNGCVVQDDTSTCGLDVAVAPWGNFYPVYSKSLNKNFKNEPCAICHGADTNDIEHWDSYITFTGRAVHFVSAMVDFYETYNSDDVTVVFDPPSEESRSMEMRCYEMIDECSSSRNDAFYIPSSVQLGRAEIIKACTNGPRALFIKDKMQAYKNVFCAMCGGFTIEEQDALNCSPNEGRRTGQSSITGLIDTKILQSSKPTTKGSRESGSCFRQINELNESRCVQPYCPALQVRVSNGECEYPSEKMIASCFRLFLKVSTEHAIEHRDIFNMDRRKLVPIFQKKTPWHDGWQIVMILLGPSTNRTEFFVLMSVSTRGTISMRKLTIDVKRRLSKPWSLHINDEIEYKQRMLPTNFGDENVMLYRDTSGNHRFCPVIGRFFFCQQIELRPSEYKFTPGDGFDVVHLEHSGKSLFKDEFTLLVDADGSQKVRVCLEDSGYVRVDSASKAACMSYRMCSIAQASMLFLAFTFVL